MRAALHKWVVAGFGPRVVVCPLLAYLPGKGRQLGYFQMQIAEALTQTA